MNTQQCLTGNDFWVLAIFCIGISAILEKILFPVIKMIINFFKKKPIDVIVKELTIDETIEELQKLKAKSPSITFSFAKGKLK